MLDSFYEWAKTDQDASAPREPSGAGFRLYFQGIAEARYVIRKVFRLVDEQARKAGIEPLEHQALIQILGAQENRLRVSDVAERLDIAPALASRIVKGLKDRGLVTQSPSDQDRRITLLEVTDTGRDLLAEIDREVHVHVEYFQRNLRDSARVTALGIFAFYLGASPRVADLERLLTSTET